MPPLTLITGIDGSRESLDAAAWAAREAERRGLVLQLLQAGAAHHDARRAEHFPPAESRDTPDDEADGPLLERAARQLTRAHPTLEIHTVRTPQPPVPALLDAAEPAEALVLGSRGFSAFAGFLVGSVALSVAARAGRPVILVRAGELPQDEHLPGPDGTAGPHSPYRPVVLGIDLDRPSDDLLAYAFEAAAVRRAPLRVLHSWTLPPLRTYPPGVTLPPEARELQEAKQQTLAAVLQPWHNKFPDIQVMEHVLYGRPAHHLIKAATGASLLTVGRTRAGTRLGGTAHSVVHHVTCPVAVVPHD
ncbi:universal stress protein [Streptomyces monticola]|uniref:Universal stress protein n=1 Tax=Streptomyces monticola TaxID=2666263 RepID=A0ABW2JCP0_9ACTN